MKPKAAALALALVMLTGCAGQGLSLERRISGKTVGELFPDTQVADLARAACSGNEGEVARLIGAGANPNAVGNERAVPLLWAIRCHNVRGVEALLSGGADPNLGGDFTPLYLAAQEPNAILKALLKHGGDPNAGSKESRRSALIEAMSMGINERGWENYYTLLEAGADINKDYGYGDTIAQFAAAMAQYDKLAELLDKGYNTNLDWLGAFVQNRAIPPNLEPKRALVRSMLEARGVTFPVPPMRAPGA